MATTIKIDDVLESYLKDTQERVYIENGFKLTLSATLHHLFYEQIKANQQFKGEPKKTESLKKTEEKSSKKVAKLSPNQQKILKLSEQGLSNQEISDQTGLKKSSVSATLSKAKRKQKELSC